MTYPFDMPRRKTDKTKGWVFLTLVVLDLAFSLIAAGVAMFLLGVANEQDDRVPAFGFWTVFLVGEAIKLVARTNIKKKSE